MNGFTYLVCLIKFFFLSYYSSLYPSLSLTCSLEHLVKTSLKAPTNQNQHHSNNNQSNIPSMPSEFLQPQQHQLQIQINGSDGRRRSAEQQVSSFIGTQTTEKLMSPKTAKASQVMLSSASGPVTDL